MIYGIKKKNAVLPLNKWRDFSTRGGVLACKQRGETGGRCSVVGRHLNQLQRFYVNVSMSSFVCGFFFTCHVLE